MEMVNKKITRKEYINILQTMSIGNTEKEAIEYAIKQIKQVKKWKRKAKKIDKHANQGSYDDVVSRRALIDVLSDEFHDDLVANILSKLPPVKLQEPKDDKCYYCEHNFTPYQGNTGEFTEQEPISVKHDTFPVKLQINKMSKHISNIDLDEFEQEPKICEKCLYAEEIDGNHCYECVKGESKFEPKTGHYEKHTDHTDCIWYGSDSGCPVTCSQYRDGWNDAMDYIFKNGKGYQPYRHDG